MKLAFDRASVRSIDTDGRMHIAKSHISKAQVSPYYGHEIPKWEELGLKGDQIYKMFRDPVELERAASSFARLPIQIKHVHTTADDPQHEIIAGSIGSDVTFDDPYLDADLSIWDAQAIAAIESGEMQELSCAYHYDAVMNKGEYDGEPYDGVMTNIKGNHLALVPVGRAGSDVIVADSNPFLKESHMKMTNLGKALLAALSMASTVIASDSAFPALLATASKKTLKLDELKKTILAKDASLDSNKLDAVLDAIIDANDDPNANQTLEANDAAPAEKVRAMLKGKVDDAMIEEICKLFGDKEPAEDGKVDDVAEPKDNQNMVPAKDAEEKGMKKDEVKAAMDAAMAGLTKKLRAAEQARRDVRPVVGDVTVAMDSAAEVYGFALDQLGVDHKGIEDTAALGAMFKLASEAKASKPSTIATDAQGAQEAFPGLARFNA